MWPGFFRMVPEYLSGHLIYRFQHAVQKLLLRELPPLYAYQFRFSTGGEGGFRHFHSTYRLI